MNIGMILDKTFPPDPRVENEAKQLIYNGHKINLFCLNFTNQKSNELINGINIYRYKFSKKLHDKLSPLAYTFPFYHWLLGNKIKKFIKSTDLDAIHIHDMIAAEPVFKLSEPIPKILDLHENRPEIMKSYTHITTGMGKLLINLAKWKRKEFEFVKKAERTIVVTPEAKQYYLNNIPHLSSANIISAPNTIDTDIFLNYKIRPKIVDNYKDDFTILYLGSVAKRRGIGTVINAVNVLKNQIPNIKFIIVGGKTRDMPILKEVAKKFKVNEQVVFEGWQDLKLFPSYIKASDICVSPLERNLHHDTTFANKLFQYMSIGRPVIVSDCPAQANVVKKYQCGLIHEAENSEDLANKILKLYNNPYLREQMGNNGKQAVLEKYNWEKTGKNLVNLYKNLPYSTK